MTEYEHFRQMPKMTNNHLHIFAMFPYRRLLKVIQNIDPELYSKIYYYDNEVTSSSGEPSIVKYLLTLTNEESEGVPYNDVSKKEDWKPLADAGQQFWDLLVVRNHLKNPFKYLEQIQLMFRIFVRHYKIYYYMWYCTLLVNFYNKVYYLNVRGKPGTINKDVKHGHRLFMESKNVLPSDAFNKILSDISQGDTDISPSDYKFLYKQYTKIKYECDLIMKAVSDFNKNHTVVKYIDGDELINGKNEISLPPTEQDRISDDAYPIMMVQYIITYHKQPKTLQLDIRKYIMEIKKLLYVAVIINKDYGYQFFNGIDLVGNEQETHTLIEYMPYLGKLLYFRKYGINFIPHYGESDVSKTEMNPIEKFFIEKNISRFGHGMELIETTDYVSTVINQKKRILIESCPISNELMGYYKVVDNPHKDLIDNPNFKLMICTDDNGLFGYSSVTRDYMIIANAWNLVDNQFMQITSNGLEVIDKTYRSYYIQLHKKMWIEFEQRNSFHEIELEGLSDDDKLSRIRSNKLSGIRSNKLSGIRSNKLSGNKKLKRKNPI